MNDLDSDVSDIGMDDENEVLHHPKKAVSKKRAANKAPVKKAPTRGRAKKDNEPESEEAIDVDDIEDDDEEEVVPKPKQRASRAQTLRQDIFSNMPFANMHVWMPAVSPPRRHRRNAVPAQRQRVRLRGR